MTNLFDSFQAVNLNQWTTQLIKDLKGQPEELLERVDTIEGFSFSTFQHQESTSSTPVSAWNDKYARGIQRESNLYFNIKTIEVDDVLAANKTALTALNSGANGLRFEHLQGVELSVLLKDILTDVIHLRFVTPSIEQIKWLFENHYEQLGVSIYIELDALEIDQYTESLIPLLKQKQFPVFCSNGYKLQQTGASIIQQITFILTAAHDALCSLMEKGFSIDQAAACIHFTTGVGEKYFYEIAKTRTLRMLWTRIIEAYTPSSSCSKNIFIYGMTGFMNKSIKDPHTNLLRQTTEISSLIIGGADAVCCLPHDTYSTKGESILAARMALNIPNVLLEESYLDKVIDPYAGSYAVETLSNLMAEKAWNSFSHINEKGGFTNPLQKTDFQEAVLATRQERINAFIEGKTKLIGINTFSNPENIEASWKSTGAYFGIDNLVYERIEA